MKKRLPLTILALLACFSGISQNWAAFTSGRTYHYKSDTATALPDQSIHFDSVQAVGLDSAFGVARRFVFPVDTSQRNQPMFIGRDLRAFSDGTFNFRNPNNIGLPTRAGVGTSFTLDSIAGLSATVTRVYQGMVLGAAVDSIKVFKTQVMSLDSLVLSKSHGILEWPASLGGARFVLSGIQEEHLGDTLPGFDGYFDLPEGADFYYESDLTEGDLILEEHTFRVKFHVDTAQRVMGGQHVAWHGLVRHSYSMGGILQSITYSDTSGSFLIADRPKSILEKSHHEQVRAPKMLEPFKMPAPWATYLGTGAVDSLNTAWNGLWTTMTHHRISGKTELHLGRSNGAIGWLYYGIGGDTCVRANDDQIRAVFREGFGLTHVEWGSFFNSGHFDLIGSIVNGDTAGTVIPDGELLAAPDVAAATLQWKVYPNPSDGVVQVQWEQARRGEVVLADLAGKVLRRVPAQGLGTTLDVHDLPAGLYILHVTLGDMQASKRLSVTH